MTIGARLREKHLRLVLSQRERGEIGGVEASAQRHYEDASRFPKANFLAVIMRMERPALFTIEARHQFLR